MTVIHWANNNLPKKPLHEHFGGGGRSIGTPSRSTFRTSHPIDIFGTYNNLPLYFQLSETTWRLIGFHGNQSYINDVTSGRHLGFLSFKILFKFQLYYQNDKTAFSDWNLQNSRIICKVVGILSGFSEKVKFHVQQLWWCRQLWHHLISVKRLLTNKEQLYQSFRQSVKERKWLLGLRRERK